MKKNRSTNWIHASVTSKSAAKLLSWAILIGISAPSAEAAALSGAYKAARAGKIPRPGTVRVSEHLGSIAATRIGLNQYSASRNISAILNQALDQRRIDEIDALHLQKVYQELSPRGDFILLECWRHSRCDIRSFGQSSTVTQAGNNQLHLMHAARCSNCQITDVYKLSGRTGEAVMDEFYARTGWVRLPGEIGNSGIDGLYVKYSDSDVITDLLVVESKYNKSVLSMTKTSGAQMSKTWIQNNLRRLIEHSDREGNSVLSTHYRQALAHVDNDHYRGRLWEMNVDNDQLQLLQRRIMPGDRSVRVTDLTDEELKELSVTAQMNINLFEPSTELEAWLAEAFWRNLEPAP